MADGAQFRDLYLAALTQSGMLRAEDAPPRLLEYPHMTNLMATLATGILAGPAGQAIKTENLQEFFDSLRTWYGHNDNLIAPKDPGAATFLAPTFEFFPMELRDVNDVPRLMSYDQVDLQAASRTRQQSLRVYSPWVAWGARKTLPADYIISGFVVDNEDPFLPVNLSGYFDAKTGATGFASIVGPDIADSNGFVPVTNDLPYTIRFQNPSESKQLTNEIRIQVKLDLNADPRSFRVGEMQVGALPAISVPLNQPSFTGEYDFASSHGLILRVSGGMDLPSATASWIIQAIDPGTGEVIRDTARGLLPPNNASGDGAGYVKFTVRAADGVTSREVLPMKARVTLNNIAPEDTPEIYVRFDADIPESQVTVSTAGLNYRVDWSASDVSGGSKLQSTTLYVSEDNGPYRIWKTDLTDTSGTEVFQGQAGRTYRFTSLATDKAGNREIPRVGTHIVDATPTNASSDSTNAILARLGNPPAPTPAPSTNPLFIAAQREVVATPPASHPSQYSAVLQPLSARAFATGFTSDQAQIGPMAIVEAPDGSIIVSGGIGRKQLFRYQQQGGDQSNLFAIAEHPIFSLAFDRVGRLWATTGGGPLLQLDPNTGAVLNSYGDGITLSVVAHPSRDELVVTTQLGIQKFDLASHEFESITRDRELRFGDIAFDNSGNLWGTVWPQRNSIVKINDRGRAENQFVFDMPVDSIAFGKPGSVLDGLLLATTNSGLNGRGGDLIAMDLVTRRRLSIARDGTRGDTVETTSDGRIFVSQSNQVDVLNAQLDPIVASTNPPTGAIVALPFSLVAITFDQEMQAGDPSSLGSVLNPANYQLIDKQGGSARILRVTYDPRSFTVLLTLASLGQGDFDVVVNKSVRNRLGVAMKANFVTSFTTLDSAVTAVDFQFSNSRLERTTNTISYDVSITNRSDRPLILPLYFVLDANNGYRGVPENATGSVGQRWIVNFSGNVPGGVRLMPGASTTGQTVSIGSPYGTRVNFTNSASASMGPNEPPAFVSTPVLNATPGRAYNYQASAVDPDGSALVYVLIEGPTGMNIHATTGQVNWMPGTSHLAQSLVVIRAYDPQGAWAEQTFTIAVAGGNRAPLFATFPRSLERAVGLPIVVPIIVNDEDNDSLRLWANNLPAGAFFDSVTRALYWTPEPSDVGTHSNIRIFAADGKATVSTSLDITILPRDLPPVLRDPGGRVLREGDLLVMQLAATDPDGDSITYAASGLPSGASIEPSTGLLRWTPAYDQEGVYEVTFTALANGQTSSITTALAVLNANAAPVFDPVERWRAFEKQTIEFRIFASDPDNPEFVPPVRRADGTLAMTSNTSATVTYRPAQLLPDGATFDVDTGIFRWTPEFNQAGTYTVSFTATDDGDGVGASATSTLTIPIEVMNLNRAPVVPIIAPVLVPRDGSHEFDVVVTDADGDPITLTAASELVNRRLPAFISFEDLGSGRGRFRINPRAGDRGSHPISLTAVDTVPGGDRWGRLTTVMNFVVNVSSPNDPPVLRYIGDRVAIVGQPFEIELQTSDLDQEPLAYALSGLSHASIVPGTFYGQAFLRWTPTAADLGAMNVTVSVDDTGNGGAGEPLADSETWRLVVRSSNAAPVLNLPAKVNASERSALLFNVPATDVDGDPLRYMVSGSLPDDARLDPATGRLTWMPTTSGDYAISISASDGNLTTTGTLTVSVADVNEPPVLQPVAPQYGREGAALRVLLGAVDPDQDAVTLSIDNLPRGAVLNASTNVLTWIPDVDQAGDYRWTVVARDSRGGVDSMVISTRIDEVNRAPQLEFADYAGVVGRKMEFKLKGSDADRDVLRYSAVRLPDGAVLNEQSGVFTWTPRPGQAGEYLVKFLVNDGTLITEQTLSLVVTNDVVAPELKIELVPNFPVLPGEEVQVRLSSVSRAGTKSLKLYVNGKLETLDTQGRLTIKTTGPGQMMLEGIVEDNQGMVVSHTEVIRVRDVNDKTAPSVQLEAAQAGLIINSMTDLRATISDSNLDQWQLFLSPWGSDDSVELARGRTAVSGSVFSLDPGQWQNGVYRLRLQATDITGRFSSTESKIEINSSLKPGAYRTSETEFVQKKSFGSIALTRVYDSTLTNSNTSFGRGWRWAELDFLVQTDVPLTGRESLGIYEPLQSGSRAYVSLPDGARVGFTFMPELVQVGALSFYKPHWQSDTGVATELFTVDAMLTRAGGKFYELGSGLPYHPANNLFEGDNYRVRFGGLEYKLDANGRTTEIWYGPGCSIYVSDSNLSTDNAAGIQVVRDSHGRVARVSNGVSGYLEYQYDAQGRLVKVIDQQGSLQAAYRYDSQSRLILSQNLTAGQSIRYPGTPMTDTIDKVLGSVAEFTGKTESLERTAALQRFSVNFSELDLASSPRGEFMLRVVTEGVGITAAPTVQMQHAKLISRATVDNRQTSLFLIQSAGPDLLQAAGPAGSYTLTLSIAGDVNNDQLVDGNDATLVNQVEAGSTDELPVNTSFEADINGDGVQDFGDRLILLYNLGYTPIEQAFAALNSGYAMLLESGSDDSLPGDDNSTSRGTITVAGFGRPFASVELSGQNKSAQVLLNGMFAFFDVPLVVGTNHLVAMSSAGLAPTPVSELTVIRTGQENVAPTVTLGLLNDTGWNSRDRITMDAVLVGTALDASGIGKLEMAMAGDEWLDITAQLASGSFEITDAEWTTIFGQRIVDGRYDLQLRAVDALGNLSAIVPFSFVLDRTAPDGTDKPSLSSISDTGTDDSDGVTNKREVIVNARTGIGDRVDVLVNGALVATQLSNGSVSIPVTLTSPGAHSLVLINRDDAGNASAPSVPLVVVLDEQAPTSFTATLSSDSGVIGDGRTEREVVSLVGTTETASTVALYRANDLLNPIARVTPDAQGNYRIDGIALRNGFNAFQVAAEDLAGNSRRLSLGLESTAEDTSAPTIVARLRRDSGRSQLDRVTSQATVLATIDDPSGISAVTVSINGGPLRDVTPLLRGNLLELTTGRLSTLIGDELRDGQYQLAFTARDSGGRVSSPTEFSFTLDASRPASLSLLDLAPSLDTGISNTDNITALNSFLLTTTVEPDAIVRFYHNGLLQSQTSSGSTRTLTTSDLLDGVHTFTYTSEDLAGNISSFSLPTTIIVDRLAPTSLTFAMEAQYADAEGSTTTAYDTIVLVGTTEPNVKVRITGTAREVMSDARGVFRFEDIRLVPGVNDFALTATDMAGNVRSTTANLILDDRFGPTVQLALAKDTGESNSDSITSEGHITGVVRDASGVASVEMSIDSEMWIDIKDQLSAGFLTLTESMLRENFSQFGIGANIIRFRALDTRGNQTERTVKIVLDQAPPLAIVPYLIPEDDSGTSSYDQYTSVYKPRYFIPVEPNASVVWYRGGKEIERGHVDKNGIYQLSALPDGQHDLSIRVMDSAGNISQESAFVQIVIDTRQPDFLYGLSDQSDTDVKGDRRTSKSTVDVIGQTEPGGSVYFINQDMMALTDTEGSFIARGVSLQPGENLLPVQVYDRAGNVLSRVLRFINETSLEGSSAVDLKSSPDSYRSPGPQFGSFKTPGTRNSNQAPLAKNDTFQADEDNFFSSSSSVLANDSDPDYGPTILQAILQASVSEHSPAVRMSDDGSFTLDPTTAFNWLGEGEKYDYPLTYRASDGEATTPAVATVTINGRNDAPDAQDDGVFYVASTQLLNLPVHSLLYNDTDADRSDTLRVVEIEGLSPLGARYKLYADGRLLYDPTDSQQIKNAIANGGFIDDAISYTVTDRANATDQATVSFRVVATVSNYTIQSVANTVDAMNYSGKSTLFGSSGQVDLSKVRPGVSLNNLGWVAFTAEENLAGKTIANIYSADMTSASRSINRLMNDLLNFQIPAGDTLPALDFGQFVQINDQKSVLATRFLTTESKVGDIIFGVSIPLELSYLERWDATTPGAIWTQSNVVMGDSGIFGDGLKLRTLSPSLASLGQAIGVGLNVMGAFGLVPGLLGGLLAVNRLMDDIIRPPVYVWKPIWAGLAPSTPNYNAEVKHLRRELPAVFNNSREPAYVFSAKLAQMHDYADALVTYPNSPTPYVFGDTGPSSFRPRIADNGTWVTADSQKLYFNNVSWSNERILTAQQLGLKQIGIRPSITDDGSLIAFGGIDRQDRFGIYVTDPNTSKTTKVIGVSDDGVTDLNEVLIDERDFGIVTGIDINAQINIAHSGDGLINIQSEPDPRYYIQFTGERGITTKTTGLEVATLQVSKLGTTEPKVDFETLQRVVQQNDMLQGIGKVQEVSTFDGLNSSGNLAFWAKGEYGEGVFLAHSPTLKLFVDANNDGTITEDIMSSDYLNRDREGKTGLVLPASLGDSDGDGLPDWIDGFDQYSESPIDDVSTGSKFSKLVVELPSDMKVDSNLLISFDYVASEFEFPDIPGRASVPNEGELRIWRKDGSSPRKVTDDYIIPKAKNKTYSAVELGFTETRRKVTLYIEAISNPKDKPNARIVVTATQQRGGQTFVARDAVRVTVSNEFLYIDSDNTNGINMPDRSDAERAEKNPIPTGVLDGSETRELPGKIVIVNDDDVDNDGVPDFADGFESNYKIFEDESLAGDKFVPLVIALPTTLNRENAKVIFTYDASGLADIRSNVSEADAGSFANPFMYQLNNDAGSLRLWKGVYDRGTDNVGSWSIEHSRNFDRDYIEPLIPLDLESQLQFEFNSQSNRWESVVFIEALKASEELADLEIEVEFQEERTADDGTKGVLKFRDSVRVTAIDLTIALDDRSTSRQYVDLTTETRPFPFWVNDDFDDYDLLTQRGLLGSNYEPGLFEGDLSELDRRRHLPDFSDREIHNSRDLEDFLSFQVSISLLTKLPEQYRSVLSAEGTGLAVNVFEFPFDLGNGYLQDRSLASQFVRQWSMANPPRFLGSSWYDEIPLESEMFQELENGQLIKQLYLEAKQSGSGALVLTLQKSQDGSDIIVGRDSTYLEALPTHSMNGDFLEEGRTEHVTVGRSVYVQPDITGQYPMPNTVTPQKVSQIANRLQPPMRSTFSQSEGLFRGAGLLSTEGQDPPNPEKQFILFVHGWRLSVSERDLSATTAFKRLFWQGYRGDFGYFTWPTDYDPSALADLGSFNRSEEVAWNAATPLLTYLKSLKADYNKDLYVFAHSMGNYVIGEALRLYTQQSPAGLEPLLNTYVASNSAVPARVYSETVGDLVNYFAQFPFLDGNHLDDTIVPDIYGNYPLTGKPYFADIGKAAFKTVSFYNDDDQAFSQWVFDLNHLVMKPDDELKNPDVKQILAGNLARQKKQSLYNYRYSPDTELFSKTWRDIGSSVWIADMHSRLESFDQNRYEIFAYIGQSHTKALGAVKLADGPFTDQVNMQGEDKFPGSTWDVPLLTDSFGMVHSAQFLGDVMNRWWYYSQLLSSFGLQTANTAVGKEAKDTITSQSQRSTNEFASKLFPYASSDLASTKSDVQLNYPVVKRNPGNTSNNEWQFGGNGKLDGPGALSLTEHNTLISNARRDYTLNPSKRFFKFEIHDLVLANNGPDVPTDAFEAALGLTKDGAVNYVNRITTIARTDGLLNIQQDGTYYAGPGVTVTGTLTTGNRLNLAEPIFVTVDISNLPASTVATLGFDLIGFGNTNSSVRIVVPEGPNTQNSISGFVYEDANNNGLFESGEKPISGVTVSLSGDAERSMVTGSDGAYRFDGLLDGLYTITQTQPNAYADGRETQGTPALGTVENNRFLNMLLENDVAATGYNFGELPLTATDNSISGFVYLDADNDGVYDSNEQPIEGATIHLFGPVSSSFTTRRDGLYSFTSLPSGLYRVVQTQPAGYDDGRETQGTPVTGSIGEDRFVNLSLTSGTRLVGYNFAERPQIAPQPNSLAGAVYLDTNNNGVYDTSEKPLPGVVIQLTGPVTRTFVTADDGTYRFTNLPSGVYTVAQEQPDSYEDGPESRGTPPLGTVENDRFVDLNLSGGIEATGYHFAERPIATGTSFITGWVYLDRNQNNRRDADEPGLNQVELRLSGPVSRTVFTNNIGQYAFTDLPAGSYTVTQVQPAPYDSGFVRVGSNGGTVSGEAITSIALNGTGGGSNYNFAEHVRPKPSYNSIGGVVYLDSNNNGRRDSNERVIPGVTINLAGPVNRTVVTGSDGTYAFVNLPDGVYSVVQTQPATFIDGLDTQGSPIFGTVGNDRFENIGLSANALALHYNFGESALVDPAQVDTLTAAAPSESVLLEKMRGDGERWQPSTGPQSLGFNHHYALDAHNDGFITPLDALVIINAINSNGTSVGATRSIAGYTVDDGIYLDINGDRFLTPLDALILINFINIRGSFQIPGDGGDGEGELRAEGEGGYVGVHWSMATPVVQSEPKTRWLSDSIMELTRFNEPRSEDSPASLWSSENHWLETESFWELPASMGAPTRSRDEQLLAALDEEWLNAEPRQDDWIAWLRSRK